MKSDTPSSLSTTGQADSALHAEQVRLLFRFSVVGYLATLLVLTILGLILWEDLAKPALFAWFGAMAIVTVLRYALYKIFLNRAPPLADLPRWEQAFLAGSVATALLWAIIGTLLLPEATRLVQRLSVVMLVTLLLTGAVAYYAPHRFAYKLAAFIEIGRAHV